MKCYFLKYGKRKHRGGLQESLETTCFISEREFQQCLSSYDYYCFDDRCNQILFINTDEEFTWLFIEINEMKGLYYKPM